MLCVTCPRVSPAEVTVSDAVLTSNMSEGTVIEGKNSITLNNCQITVSNTQRNGHRLYVNGKEMNI